MSEDFEILLPEERAVPITDEQLAELNRQLAELSAEDVLMWAYKNIPQLCQVTSFGTTGLVISALLSKKKINIPVVFIDTLHLFPESYAHVEAASTFFELGDRLHIARPMGAENETQFSQVYGEKLWETDPDRYDFLAKVEPQRRVLAELDVAAWITGRRKDQGGDRKQLEILEFDALGLLTINPLCHWSSHDVWSYIRSFEIPYNPLHDQGYKSLGDRHSTFPVGENEDERSGRWKG
eukprot:TRINITY_DN9428_c0_g2_i2.p1 TRINITY_DN9428_c0_g2~~TRINITY_DN9428_c0_g2_i2.p1  ORF type:complete len:238 (+),score=60.62 TRINITY_DN9428_c0_g2_i2:63-776(+)